MGLHAVAAQDLQFVGKDAIHGQGGMSFFPYEQAHLYMPAPLSQAIDRIKAGLGIPQGIDGDVSAALGRFAHGVGHIRHDVGI